MLRPSQKITQRLSVAWLRAAIIAAAAAAIALGITNNEFMTVLAKGVRVCLECMGIG